MFRLLIVLSFLGACSTTYVEVLETSASDSDLDQALMNWAENEPIKYRFVYVLLTNDGNETPESEVTVEKGIAVSGGMTVTDLLVHIVEWNIGYPESLYVARFHSEFGLPLEFRSTLKQYFKADYVHDFGFRITSFEYFGNAN